ncbi:MAG: hypothetical protein AAB597_03350 [Patescibacteria group bacterium]
MIFQHTLGNELSSGIKGTINNLDKLSDGATGADSAAGTIA